MGRVLVRAGHRRWDTFTLRVLAGNLRCRSIRITATAVTTKLRVGSKEYAHGATGNGNQVLFETQRTDSDRRRRRAKDRGRRLRPTIVFVGGFLGAGKTTLILAAALELKKRGMRCAAILNDQSEGLVDTQLAELHGVPSGEVTAGCFCCRLSDLTAQLEAMLGYSPDVIFAEPVGSCTDISATVLHPLLAQQGAYRLAPFTVLVDPIRAMHGDAARRGREYRLSVSQTAARGRPGLRDKVGFVRALS